MVRALVSMGGSVGEAPVLTGGSVHSGGSSVDGWVGSGGPIIGGFTADRWIIHGWVDWGNVRGLERRNVSICGEVGRGAVFVISRRGSFITLMIQFQSVDLCQDFLAVIHIAQLECALAKNIMNSVGAMPLKFLLLTPFMIVSCCF